MQRTQRIAIFFILCTRRTPRDVRGVSNAIRRVTFCELLIAKINGGQRKESGRPHFESISVLATVAHQERQGRLPLGSDRRGVSGGGS